MDIFSIFEQSALRYRGMRACEDDNRSVSFEQMYDRVLRISTWLLRVGVSKGDRVCLLLNNCIYWAELDFAIARVGAVRARLNVRDGFVEHKHIISELQPKVVVCNDVFADYAASLPGNHLLAVAEKSYSSQTLLSLEAEIAKIEEIYSIDAISPDSIYCIMHTSGTSGNYKGAFYTHRKWINATIRNTLVEPLADLGRGDVFAHVAPVTHMSGCLILPTLIRGGINRFFEKFDPSALLQAIDTGGVTHSILAPTMLTRVCQEAASGKYDLSQLKTLLYAASPIGSNALDEALSLFGAKLYQGYGLTESLFFVSRLDKSDHLTERARGNKSCGLPFPWLDVKIDTEQGTDNETDTVGELCVRGDNLCDGYWPEIDKGLTDDEGWFHTGDVARIDENGYLYIVDRKNDMIISGGFNVYPKEVEDIIRKMDGVEDCGVVGAPDDAWGERVCAFVVTNKGSMTESSVVEFCQNSGLGRYKKPSMVKFVDDLPRNSGGKLLRRELKRLILGSADSSAAER